MNGTFGTKEHVRDQLPKVPAPYAPSAFTPEQAHIKARQLLLRELGQRNEQLLREMYIECAPEQRTIVYRVESSLDVSSRYPQTQIYLGARSGALLGFHAATGEAAGNTITNWLYALHFASVGGWVYRLVVAVTGLLVAILSVTGVWIWLRKRQTRAARVTATSAAVST
jgi:uncharacterized iron-regulated membrane protein